MVQQRIHVKAFKDVVADPTSTYPEPFHKAVSGRIKRRLGKAAGLKAFSVLLIDLPPGAASSLRMRQSHEDYFYMVLHGAATLVTDDGEEVMSFGECAGFVAGHPAAHHVVNRTEHAVTLLEVASFVDENVTTYPDQDLLQVPSPLGRQFVRGDGSAY